MISRYYFTRFLLLLASIAAIAVFWFVGISFDVPMFLRRSVSLLQQPTPGVAILAVIIAFCVSLIIGTVIAGRIRIDAGLATAAVGLAALSIRSGPIRFTLMYGDSAGVFRSLAVETIVLYAIIAAGWFGLWTLGRLGWLRDDREDDGIDPVDQTFSTGAMALAAHAIVTAFVLLILGQSDEKAQVLASVFVAAFIASLAAHYLFPTRPSPWYWCGPLIVAVIGYLLAASNSPLWMIGQIGGYAPPLARPAPLDYASAGTVGSLIGYWMSRQWMHEQTEVKVRDGTAVE